jgi:hypothetical protein
VRLRGQPASLPSLAASTSCPDRRVPDDEADAFLASFAFG